MRRTLLTLQEDQILDNLVRIEKGLPIVHLDYSNLFAEMTDTFGATTGSVGYNDTDAALRTVQGAAPPANTSLVGVGSHATNLSAGTSGTAVTNLTITATSVIGQNSVYAAYLAYNHPLNGSAKRAVPGAESPLEGPVSCAPPPGSFILRKQYAEGWYYVPVAYRDEFRALGMAVGVATREKSAKAAIWRTHVVDAERLSKPIGPSWTDRDSHSYAIKLHPVLRQDRGHFTASLKSLGGEKVRFEFLPAIKTSLLNKSFHPGVKGTTDVFGRKVDDYTGSKRGDDVDVLIVRIPHRLLPIVQHIVDPNDSSKTKTIRMDPKIVIDEILASPKGFPFQLDNYPNVTGSVEEALLKNIANTLNQQLLQGK